MTAIDASSPAYVEALTGLRLAPDTLEHRVLEDGSVLTLHTMLFGYQISLTRPDDLILGVKSDVWDYAGGGGSFGHPPLKALALAVACVEHWDGESDPPDGWTRHPATGRRRPQGDATREFVRR